MMEMYETWDTTPPELPARSQLYKLSPIVLGTPMVEILCCYIARLALEHCLSAYILLSKVILTSEEEGCRLYQQSVHVMITRVLNGIGTRPQILTKNLERLTSYPNIRLTTMVTYAGVLSYQHLVVARWRHTV